MSLVVIYDSGVGGLSIFQQVVATCPQHDYVFVSDNAAFPYGTKSKADLVNRVTQVTERIAEHYAPDILIVACNTASTVVLPMLREKFDFSIVGVVPAIKPAARLSMTQHIGLLATPATIKREYTNGLIRQFASDCEVTRVGSSELVDIAEQCLRGHALDLLALERILTPFIDAQSLDVLVLACTHFPLLNKQIGSIFKSKSREILLLDSGGGVAGRVAEISAGDQHQSANWVAAFTGQLDEPELFDYLATLKFSELEILNI